MHACMHAQMYMHMYMSCPLMYDLHRYMHVVIQIFCLPRTDIYIYIYMNDLDMEPPMALDVNVFTAPVCGCSAVSSQVYGILWMLCRRWLSPCVSSRETVS